MRPIRRISERVQPHGRFRSSAVPRDRQCAGGPRTTPPATPVPREVCRLAPCSSTVWSAGGRADRPDHGGAVHVLADVPERRLGRAGLRRPGERGHRLPAGLRARLAVVGEHGHPRHPGLRLPLDPRRGDRGDRTVGGVRVRHAAEQPAADRLRAVLASLPAVPGRLRPRVLLHQRHAAPLDRPDRRARAADHRPADPLPAARRAGAGDRGQPDRRATWTFSRAPTRDRPTTCGKKSSGTRSSPAARSSSASRRSPRTRSGSPSPAGCPPR